MSSPAYYETSQQREGILAQRALQHVVTTTSADGVLPQPYRPAIYAWANVAVVAKLISLPDNSWQEVRFKSLAEKWKKERRRLHHQPNLSLMTPIKRSLRWGQTLFRLFLLNFDVRGGSPEIGSGLCAL